MILVMVMEWNIYLFFFFILIEGVSGSWIIENVIVYVVVVDIMNVGKYRFFLMIFLSFVLGIGFFVGIFVFGYIVIEIGYEYLMVMLCGSVGFVIMMICFILEMVFKI